MIPTMDITMTRDRDSIRFVCDHATVETGETESPGAATTAELLQAVLARHRTACACRPVVTVQRWPSLAEAIGMHEADAKKGIAHPAVAAFHGMTLEAMRAARCSTCDPAYVITIRRGSHLAWAEHQPSCPARGAVKS